ncbi:MAG: ribonuclease Z [Patescibacteria group bacterium]|nr:ribonuclease Z [Patescibacteria group bacterium]
MKLVFLGTSAMVPTKERNVQSIYIDYNGEGILLDCGEGTQRQITIAGLNAQKIKTILISHWHGDHVSGLVGLIQTLGNFADEEKTIRLFGPVGTKKYLANTLDSCEFETKLNLDVKEIDAEFLTSIFETNDYELQAINLDHSLPCLGYSFIKKERRKMNESKLKALGLKMGPLVGKLQRGESINHEGKTIKADEVSKLLDSHKISFIFDTRLTDSCFVLAKNADLLVSEAVYLDELKNKAEEYKHMTAKQVAQVASESEAKELILTHFSQRYKDVVVLEEEAKMLFDNVRCAFDFMKVELDF